jgi:hypothetical protein
MGLKRLAINMVGDRVIDLKKAIGIDLTYFLDPARVGREITEEFPEIARFDPSSRRLVIDNHAARVPRIDMRPLKGSRGSQPGGADVQNSHQRDGKHR